MSGDKDKIKWNEKSALHPFLYAHEHYCILIFTYRYYSNTYILFLQSLLPLKWNKNQMGKRKIMSNTFLYSFPKGKKKHFLFILFNKNIKNEQQKKKNQITESSK